MIQWEKVVLSEKVMFQNLSGPIEALPCTFPRISHLRVGVAQTAGKCTVVSKLWPEMPFYLPFIRPRAKGRHKLWCFWQFHLWDSKNWRVQSFGDILWLYWTICGHVSPKICGGTNLKLRVMIQLGPIFCLFKSVSDTDSVLLQLLIQRFASFFEKENCENIAAQKYCFRTLPWGGMYLNVPSNALRFEPV